MSFHKLIPEIKANQIATTMKRIVNMTTFSNTFTTPIENQLSLKPPYKNLLFSFVYSTLHDTLSVGPSVFLSAQIFFIVIVISIPAEPDHFPCSLVS